MGSILRLARRVAAGLIPRAGRPVMCDSCGMHVSEDVRLVAGPRVYLCEVCIGRAANQLMPRRPLAAGVRCRFCGRVRAPTDATSVGSVVVCAECLGVLVEDVLVDAGSALRPGP